MKKFLLVVLLAFSSVASAGGFHGSMPAYHPAPTYHPSPVYSPRPYYRPAYRPYSYTRSGAFVIPAIIAGALLIHEMNTEPVYIEPPIYLPPPPVVDPNCWTQTRQLPNGQYVTEVHCNPIR